MTLNFIIDKLIKMTHVDKQQQILRIKSKNNSYTIEDNNIARINR